MTGGAVSQAASDKSAPGRVDVEIVLEVDDVTVKRDRVLADGGTMADNLTTRPWGLTDFRLYDPDGNHWRVTGR